MQGELDQHSPSYVQVWLCECHTTRVSIQHGRGTRGIPPNLSRHRYFMPEMSQKARVKYSACPGMEAHCVQACGWKDGLVKWWNAVQHLSPRISITRPS